MMRTEQEWAKFGKYVQVGNRVQYRNDDVIINGSLLENYPHYQRSHDQSPTFDTLRVQFEDFPASPDDILVDYEYFWHEEDQVWYRFDDIMMFDDEEQAS